MDTGKVIARQLRYCLAGAETPAQEAQVKWWISKVAALRAEQPAAEEVNEVSGDSTVTEFPAPLPMAAGFARRDEDPGAPLNGANGR